MKFIHIETNKQTIDFVGMILETGFEIHCLDAPSYNEALNLLSKEKGIYGVICPYAIGETNCLELYKMLGELKNKSMVISSEIAANEHPGLEQFFENNLNVHVGRPIKDAQLLEALENIVPSLEEIEKKDKKREGIEADWSLKKQKQAAEIEADWKIEKKKASEEVEQADWKIERKKAAGGEEEADWKIDKKGKNEQDMVQADWTPDDLKRRPEESEADWLARRNKGYQGAMTVDWAIKKKNHALPKEERENRHAEIDMVKNEVSRGYRPVKIKRIGSFKVAPCDIYIRISPTKFLKVANKDDDDFSQTVEKYEKKDFINFYIQREDYSTFLETFGKKITTTLAATKKGPARVKAAGQLLVAETVTAQIQEMGLSEKAVMMADQGVKSAVALAKKGNKLAGLLQSVMKGNNFISEHSMMITYVCSQVGMNMGWDIKSTLEKISMAAMLHDSMLPEHLARIRDHKSDEAKALSEEDRTILIEHAEVIASEVSRVTTMYPDVDSILVQHHERPDGSGFPRGLKALSISPLSALFIMAEEFAHRVYGHKITPELATQVQEEFKEIFNKGNFKKPYAAFEKFLENLKQPAVAIKKKA